MVIESYTSQNYSGRFIADKGNTTSGCAGCG